MSNPSLNNALRGAEPSVGVTVIHPAAEVGRGGPMRVDTRPCGLQPVTAAFYDEESEQLTVHILPFQPYHSFLESEQVRIDTDQQGRPIFVEINTPRQEWKIIDKFTFPDAEERVTLNFRETRRYFPAGEINTDQRQEIVCVKFLARRGTHVVSLADNLLAELADGYLVAFWILGIKQDFAARKQAKWRSTTAAQLRRGGRQWPICTRGELSRNSLTD